MPTDPKADQARYIFTTGKLIHDHILKSQCRQLASSAPAGFGDLSMAQLNVIRIIRSQGELAMGTLADLLGVAPPSASVMVDRLVEKGLLLREHSTQDRRKVVVRISSGAVEKIDSLEAGIIEVFMALVEKIGPDATENWCQVLETVQAALLDIDPTHGQKE